MKRIILTEGKLTNIVQKVIKEQKEMVLDDLVEEMLVHHERLESFLKFKKYFPNKKGKHPIKDLKDIMKNLNSISDEYIRAVNDNVKPLKEQDEEEEHTDVHDDDMFSLNQRIGDIEDKLNELEDDYVRKIGYGDHHHQTHRL